MTPSNESCLRTNMYEVIALVYADSRAKCASCFETSVLLTFEGSAEKPESASAPLRSRRELMTQLALSSAATASVLCGFPQPSQAGFDLDSLIGTTSNGLPKGK